MFDDKWWFILILSFFSFYKGFHHILSPNNEKVLGGFGGKILQYVKTQYGPIPLSIIFFILGFLLLYFAIRSFKNKT